MCEVLVTAWAEPEPFARVLPWALQLERVGVAGFGWGVAWREGDRVMGRRDPGRLSEDRQAQETLATVRSTHFLVHLRRPSRLSTISLADTQPFVEEAGRFAFAHNGQLEGAAGARGRFSGQLAGRADSEVGFRLFEALLSQGRGEAEALAQVHAELGGRANLAVLPAAGAALVYAGNRENDFWRFRLEGAEVASTALHSADQALFSLCFPDAQQPERVGWRQVVAVADQHPSQPGAAPARALAGG
ncbi:MAG: class II glutamine amidotransferase [Candidatus Dormibacteria bacterium]